MNNPLNKMCKVYREYEDITNPLFTFQDVCGPVYLWPSNIKKIIASKTLKYQERLKLTTFLYVNGLQDASEWMNFIVDVKGNSFERYRNEIFSLFKYYCLATTQNRYYAYCMSHKRIEYLNGTAKK